MTYRRKPINVPPCWDLCEDMITTYDENVNLLAVMQQPKTGTANLDADRVQGGMNDYSKTEREYNRITDSREIKRLKSGILPVTRAYEYIAKRREGNDTKKLIGLMYGVDRATLQDAADLIYVHHSTAARWRMRFVRVVATSLCDKCYRNHKCDFTKGI